MARGGGGGSKPVEMLIGEWRRRKKQIEQTNPRDGFAYITMEEERRVKT